MNLPSVGQIESKWKQQVGIAKILWGQVAEDELLKSEDHAQRPTGLVQECYSINRGEAEQEVRSFLNKSK